MGQSGDRRIGTDQRIPSRGQIVIHNLGGSHVPHTGQAKLRVEETFADLQVLGFRPDDAIGDVDRDSGCGHGLVDASQLIGRVAIQPGNAIARNSIHLFIPVKIKVIVEAGLERIEPAHDHIGGITICPSGTRV